MIKKNNSKISALARNNKSVLHIDGNQFYGGNECSFNFSEFLEWIMNVQRNDNNTEQCIYIISY